MKAVLRLMLVAGEADAPNAPAAARDVTDLA
jgi:hypothetical protein